MRGLSVVLGCVAAAGCVGASSQPEAYAVDEGEGWSVEDAREELAHAQRVESTSFGFARDPIWLDVDVAGAEILEVGYPQLDLLDLYVGDTHYALGDHRGFDARPIRHPTVAIPLDGQSRVTIRAESAGALAVPLRTWSLDAFRDHARDLQLGFGFFYAFLLALALYNLFLFASLRTRTYGYYFGWLFAVVISQAGFSGHAAMYLWPDSPWWANSAPTVFLCISAGFGNLFVDAMMDLHEVAPRWSKAMRAMGVAFLVVGVALIVVYSIVPLVLLLGLVDVPLIVAAIIGGLRRRQRAAVFIALGGACFLPWYLAFALANQGTLPMSFWTLHGLKIGTCLEALVLAFALADRVRVLEREKLRAQRSLSRGLLRAQDEERRRIAAELHDGIGQELSLLAGSLEGESAVDARRCIDELRRLAHDLHPDRLERLGLRDACERVVEITLDQAGIEYEHSLSEVPLTDARALHVYRILQEALTNLVRHAEATRADVTLRVEGDEAVLEVRDDGVGVQRGRDGLGLSSMDERARAAGGRLSVRALDEGGTLVELRLALAEAT